MVVLKWDTMYIYIYIYIYIHIYIYNCVNNIIFLFIYFCKKEEFILFKKIKLF